MFYTIQARTITRRNIATGEIVSQKQLFDLVNTEGKTEVVGFQSHEDAQQYIDDLAWREAKGAEVIGLLRDAV